LLSAVAPPNTELIIADFVHVSHCGTVAQGMSKDAARHAYMDIIQGWEGYGSNLFDVEQTTNKQWPKELTLAISLQGIGIFPRGEYVDGQFGLTPWCFEHSPNARLCLLLVLILFPNRRKRLAFYKYETVLSFGAPVANKYKIMVDNVGSMLFETNMVR
jgi:myosin X